MTPQEANAQITDVKKKFDDALKSFYNSYSPDNDRKELVSSIGNLVQLHTELLNKINECIGQLNVSCDFFNDRNLRVDFEATVKNFLELSFNYLKLTGEISKKHSLTAIAPAPFAYNTIESFINTFSSKPEVARLKTEFENRNISIEGFNNKMSKPVTDQTQPDRKTSIVVGAISVIIVLSVLLFKNNLSEDFRIYLRILFALGVAGLSAVLIGSLTVNLAQSLGISAAGGFAIFVIIFFYNPVGFSSSDTFSARVKLVDNDGTPVYSDEIKMRVNFDEGSSDGQPMPNIDSYEFNPVALRYIKNKVEIQLISKQWMFENKRKVDSLLLKKGNQNIIVIRDPHYKFKDSDSIKIIKPVVRPFANSKFKFFDDFSSNSNKWFVENDNNMEIVIGDKKVAIKNVKNGFAAQTYRAFPIDVSGDFVLKVKATWIQGTMQSGFGLLFCATAKFSPTYLFEISSNGHYVISYTENNIGKIKQPWTDFAFINQGNSSNTLSVRRQGNNFIFKINDHQAEVIPTAPFTAGYGPYFGLRVSDMQTVEFESFSLSGNKSK